MFRKITFWRVMPVLALLFAVLCTTCELGGTGQDVTMISDIINAKIPFITEQPQVSLSLTTLDSSIPLTVTAVTEESDGELRYQWLSFTDTAEYVNDEGTPVEGEGTGAETDEFTPPNDEDGVFHYYVRVTNYLDRADGNKYASVKSNPVIVTVTDPNNAEYPTISALTGSGYYLALPAPTVTLGVTAAVTSGDLSYKWYSAEGPATADGDELSGETSSTLTLTGKSAGTHYYYVEVTNTDNSALGSRKTGTVTSPFTVNIVNANATVTVNTAQKFQYVRGFGGMYTPWDNTPQETVADFERMFSPDGLGLNMLRIMILPNNTSIEDTMDEIITGKDGDRKDQSIYYEIVKVANKYNGYVLASPWSPPAAWKTNGTINGGGTLEVNRYQHFANYLKKFCQIMYDNEAPIYAFSLQNEPTFKATYAGCEYSTIQHRNWWQQVGSTFFTNPVPGWGGGQATERVLTMTGEAHNNVAPFHTDSTSALQTPDARQYIDLVGRHIYGAGIQPLNEPLRQGKEVWMTEHNINSGEGSYHQDSTWNYVWKLMNDIDVTIRLNNDNAFIWWTAKRFYSFIGDGTNGTTNGSIMYRGYGISHFAKFAKEMTRVAVTGSGQNASGLPVSSSNFNNTSAFNVDSTDVKVSAFESADGKTISLVMYTPTEPSGGGGVDMGTVRIKLPNGFTVDRAVAMRSNASARGVMENVIVCDNGNSAIVTLPRSEMLSLRFTKAE